MFTDVTMFLSYTDPTSLVENLITITGRDIMRYSTRSNRKIFIINTFLLFLSEFQLFFVLPLFSFTVNKSEIEVEVEETK